MKRTEWEAQKEMKEEAQAEVQRLRIILGETGYHCPSCCVDMRIDQDGFRDLHWLGCSLTDDEVYTLQKKITEVKKR